MPSSSLNLHASAQLVPGIPNHRIILRHAGVLEDGLVAAEELGMSLVEDTNSLMKELPGLRLQLLLRRA